VPAATSSVVSLCKSSPFLRSASADRHRRAFTDLWE
jgi:hypothetical protein